VVVGLNITSVGGTAGTYSDAKLFGGKGGVMKTPTLDPALISALKQLRLGRSRERFLSDWCSRKSKV